MVIVFFRRRRSARWNHPEESITSNRYSVAAWVRGSDRVIDFFFTTFAGHFSEFCGIDEFRLVNLHLRLPPVGFPGLGHVAARVPGARRYPLYPSISEAPISLSRIDTASSASSLSVYTAISKFRDSLPGHISPL